MTKAALLLTLVVAACATPREAAPAAESPAWGDATDGIRCRVVAPSSARQGDVVKAQVDVGVVVLADLTKGGVEFDPDLRHRATTLELVGAGGRTVRVAPYDPYSGMPPDFDNVPVRTWNPNEPLRESIEFPLATAWDALAPGDYRCRVRISYRPTRDGYFRGNVASADFALRIDAAAPHEETFLLPKALHVVEITLTMRDEGVETTIPVREVVYGKDDAEEVRLPRRNGFFLGTNFLRDGEMYGSLGGATIEPDGANPIDSSHGSGPEAQKLGSSYTIVIFETADAPEHMWHPGPGSGGYRELWRRTISVTPAAAHDAKSASIVVHATTSNGTPLANARIELRRLEPAFSGHRRGTTSTDGVVRFDGLRGGPYCASLAVAPDVPESWMNSMGPDCETSARIELSDGEAATAELVAPRFGVIEVVADERDFPDGVRPLIDVIHRFPGGTWSHAAHQTSWNAARPGDGRIVWRVTNAPEGRYSVTLFAKGHASSTSELDVHPGEKPTELRMKPGEPVAPIELVYDGPPLTRDHFFTMASADRAQHDVAHGTFAGKPPSAVVTDVRPGRYMLTLWRSAAAMVLDVPDGGDRRFAVSVPAWTAPAPDAQGTDVTVAVTRGGTLITRMMVAIAPASDEPLHSGKWFRTVEAWPGTFAAIPPGEWDVFAFDGVYGGWYGFEPSPRVRRVRVGADPVTVRFDL